MSCGPVHSSVMPKGVEHIELRHEIHVSRSAVHSSVMPKGVEHQMQRSALQRQDLQVHSSVMPKGVEHVVPSWGGGGAVICPFIRDAERR